MKIYEVLFLFNKQLESARLNCSTSFRYIKTAYSNVINKIKEMYGVDRNLSKSNINQLDITQHMKDKLLGIIMQKISMSDRTKLKKSRLLDDLINIAGIGRQKADDLVKLGLTSIKQLNQKKWESYLNSGTILLIKKKPLRRIPNAMIKKLEKKLTSFKSSSVKLVGGFIRKKPFSKDIDIMIVSDKKSAIFDYIKYLETQFPEVCVYSEGINKASLIIRHSSKFLKVDIFRSLVKYQHAMLLYAIGSKKTNIKMRSLARRKGYILNQYGLFKKDCDKPIPVKSERDFFKILDIPYILPTDR
jgi:DNA polymerase/3'-5' exonuclease PolX